jgi:hypothetical protein
MSKQVMLAFEEGFILKTLALSFMETVKMRKGKR